jgi:hypothetical protein
MTRGILIAGNDSSLSHAVCAEAAKRVQSYAAALIPNRLSGPVRETERSEPRILLQWNPGSPVSARTLVLAAENRLSQIDEALLICSPPSVRRGAADLLHSDIEIIINDHIKGWFFLVKELTGIFRAKQAGTLALIFSDFGSGGGKDNKADLLGPAAAAAFRAFAQSLLISSFDEPYLTLGFSSSEAGEESGFASYIFKTLDESNKRGNGKWFKYGKMNLFSR